MREQGNPVEAIADFLQRALGQRRQAGVQEAVVHRHVAGQAGGVAQQVTHRHGALRRNRCSAGAGILVGDQHPAERRQVVGSRRIQFQLARFAQHQRRHGADRLGHRVDAEDGVVRHRCAARDVHHAVRLQVRDRAVARHRRHRAGKLPVADQALRRAGDAVAEVRGQLHLFRLAPRQRRGRASALLHRPTISAQLGTGKQRRAPACRVPRRVDAAGAVA